MRDDRCQGDVRFTMTGRKGKKNNCQDQIRLEKLERLFLSCSATVPFALKDCGVQSCYRLELTLPYILYEVSVWLPFFSSLKTGLKYQFVSNPICAHLHLGVGPGCMWLYNCGITDRQG